MLTRICFCVLALAAVASATDGPDLDAASFMGKVIYIVAKTADPKSNAGSGVYENVEVKRLGDRFFVVGVIVAYDDHPAWKIQQGKKVWTPVSDIVQISEFNSVVELRQYFDAARAMQETNPGIR